MLKLNNQFNLSIDSRDRARVPRRMELTGMRRHRLEFTASPSRAKTMGISFVKPCSKKAPRPRTSVPCAVRISAA